MNIVLSSAVGFAIIGIIAFPVMRLLHRRMALQLISSIRASHAEVETLYETFRRDHVRATIRFTRGGVNADALEFLGILFELAVRREQRSYDQFDRYVLTPAKYAPWYRRIELDRLTLAQRYVDSMMFYLGAFIVVTPDLFTAIGQTEVDGDERFLHAVLATFLRGSREFRPDIFDEALRAHAHRKANILYLPASLEAYTGEPS